MDDLRERLDANLKEALRAGDTVRKAVLRGALAAIKQTEVDGQQQLDAAGVAAVLQKEVKSQRETIADAERAGRSDLVAAAAARIAILEEFLPPALSRDEISALAKAAIAESGAASPRDMGAVMKLLMPRVQGRADGKLVSSVVGELLRSAGA